MAQKNKTRDALERELEALRGRLEKTEETLRAIRRGKVDPLVAADPDGDRVFTLTGAETPYRLLIETMNEGAAILSGESVIRYCNSSFAAIMKAPLESVIGSAFESFIAPDQRSRFADLALKAKAGACAGEIFALAADGTRVPLLLSVNSLPWDIAGSLCVVATDITEAHRRENELRLSEQKYRTLFETMTQGAFVQGADGRLVDVNPAALDIFGLTREEFLRRDSRHPAWRVIREDGSPMPSVEHPSMAAVRTGRPILNVVAGIFDPRQGDYIWVVINAAPQCFPGEAAARQVFVTLHDITARKKAEKALNAYAIRQEALLAAIPDIVMEVDTNTVYTWANGPGREFFGDDVVGREASVYVADEQDVYARVAGLFDGTEDIVCLENWQRRRDGQKRLLSWWCRALRDSRGSIIGALSSARDITALWEAEQNLKRSEYLQRTLFENIPDIAWIKDADGRVLAANSAFKKSMGVAPADMTGKTDDELWQPELAAKFRSGDLQVMQAGHNMCFEEQAPDPDGVMHIYETVKIPLFNDAGNPIGVAGISRNITERRKAAEELRFASQKWRATFDSMLDPVALLNPDAEVQQCNRAFAEFVQRDFKDILGRKCCMLVHRTVEPPAECPVLRALGTRKRETMELQTGGKILHILADPILGGDGTVTGIVHIMRDITGQRRAQDVLRQSEQRMRLHVDQTMLAVIDFDTDFRVRAWNSGAEKIFGYTPQEAIGRRACDIILPDTVMEHIDSIWRDLLAQRGGSHSINDNIRKDGTRICCEWHSTPLTDASGTVIGVVGIGQDITERKRMEDDLRTLKLAVEQSTDGIVYAALDGAIRFVNKAWADMHGLRLGEITGRSISIFHTPEQLAHEVIPFNEYARAAGSQKGEVGHVRKDGSIFPTMMSSTVVKNDAGQATGFLGIARDITERKQAEETIRRLNRRYAFLSHTEQAIARSDDEQSLFEAVCRIAVEQGNFRMAWVGALDQAHKSIRPVARSGFVDGFLDTIIVSYDDRPEGQGPTGTAVREGICVFCNDIVHDLRVAPWRNEALQRGYRSSACMVINRLGQPYGALSVYSDVPFFFQDEERALVETIGKDISFALNAMEFKRQRTKAEQALRIEKQRLELAASAGSVLLWDWDIQKGSLIWSPLIDQELGLPGQEFPRTVEAWASILHPEDKRRVLEVLKRHLANGLPYRPECRVRRADGSYIWWSVAGEAIRDTAGRAVRMVGACANITELKLAEEALTAKNAELERFTYSVSHDLRSPLITIRTFAGQLGKDIADGNTKMITQDLRFIDTAAEKMDMMLEELLQLSRIGRIVNQSVETPLQELVHEVLNLVAGQIEKGGVRVLVSEEPLQLYGDRSRLAEVFQNIIENAIKFMGDQQKPLVEIGTALQAGQRCIFVRDNGMGIDPRHQDKLFGLFEKLDTTSPGAGIGLALVKRIIEVHGGRIWVESDGPGKGACFWITLPQKQVQS